jgi:hypothetical protein
MSATANTILSFIIGFVVGVFAIAFWYGRAVIKESNEEWFDERDIYSKPKLKKVK